MQQTSVVIKFFISLVLEIILIAIFLLFTFSLNINDLITNNITETVKNTYLTLLYLSLICNLYYFSKDDFIDVFKINKQRIIFFIKGLTIGSLFLLTLYSIELLNKLIEIKYFYFDPILILKVVVTSFLIALTEELLFRNFIFKNLTKSNNLTKSMIISSYIYAQLHFLRLDLSFIRIIFPIIGLFFVGMILSHCYYKKDFWYSVGLHFSWVMMISYTTQANLFIVNEKYILLSGGYYPIAGLIGIMLTIILLFIFIRKFFGGFTKIVIHNLFFLITIIRNY